MIHHQPIHGSLAVTAGEVTMTAIPEPASIILLLVGAWGITRWASRKAHS